MKNITIAVIILFQFTFSAFAVPADVEDISNQKYFPAILNEIKSLRTYGNKNKIPVYKNHLKIIAKTKSLKVEVNK